MRFQNAVVGCRRWLRAKTDFPGIRLVDVMMPFLQLEQEKHAVREISVCLIHILCKGDALGVESSVTSSFQPDDCARAASTVVVQNEIFAGSL